MEVLKMGLNDTPSADRVHIGFFGRRNAGKSSIVNAVTGQDLAVVSDVKGTTTDPVSKAMELLPMGPVVIIDTPGFDDEGSLGELRMRKTRQVLNKTDVAVLVTDASLPLGPCEQELLALFEAKKIPYIIARSKCDLLKDRPDAGARALYTSAVTREGIRELKETIAHLGILEDAPERIIGDLLQPSDLAVLVVPIDKAAPKGRLILPQQQTIRDILDANAAAIVLKETELKDIFSQLYKRPAVVITDSQVFSRAAAETPAGVPLTSFSILMARHKGILDAAVHGAAAMSRLRPGERILIAEGCTHHRQCDDIGTVKLPRWLSNYLGFDVSFDTVSGTEFPDDLSPYALVLHCGGCMLTEREMRYRVKCAQDQNVPITNYGVAIALMQGILKRSLSLFPQLQAELGERA
jgi:[FeFe] hydrogenase H-cluster maturation GTPase HydF